MLFVLSVGCTSNPWFHVDTDSDASDATGQATSTTGDVGDTSTGRPTTTGDSTGTTQSVDDSGTTDVTTGPGSTDGPGTTTMADTGTTMIEPDTDPLTEPQTTADAACGDNVVQTGEECDEGPDNNDMGTCLTNCQAATCGDNHVQMGVEGCDLGDNNSDTGACTNACKHARCGDLLVQDAVEVCDAGEANGSGVDVCSGDCQQIIENELEIKPSVNGVTGLIIKNDMNGVAGADEICKFFGMNWKAMISDGSNRIASQMAWVGLPENQVDWALQPYTAYVRFENMQTTVIGVTGKEALLGDPAKKLGDLLNPISDGEGLFWTGLNDDWTSALDANCGGWMAVGPGTIGAVGQGSDKVDNYLRDDNADAACQLFRRLYCVEQPV